MTKRPKAKFGIIVMPCLQTNFELPDKSTPLEDAILRMCKEVLDETMSKLMIASARMCALSGVEFEQLAYKDIMASVKSAIDKAPNGTALMEADGTVTTGEAIDVKLSGKRTDH